jgi:hypothetical protein
VNQHWSWAFVLVGLTAAVAIGARRAARRRVESHAFEVLVVASWALIPYCTLAASRNQDVRYIAAAFPAFVVLLSATILAVPFRSLRRVLIGTVILASVVQTSLLTVRWRVPVVPDRVIIGAGADAAVIHFDGTPLGYNRLPGDRDDASPVLAYLTASSAHGTGEPRPLQVGVLQPHATINPNTMNYLAEARGLPFFFVDVQASPSDLPALRAGLDRFDVVLFIEPPPPSRARDPREDLLTRKSASAAVTPDMLAAFSAARRWFRLVDGQRVLVAARGPAAAD